MYLIIHGGEVKGMCDTPRYVKIKNDTFVECDKAEAEAIAIGGAAYEGATAKEHDGGEVSFEQSVQLKEQGSKITINDNATADIGEILNDLSEAINELTEIISEMQEG